MISLMSLLFTLVILALIFGLIWWLISLFRIPEPIGNIVRAIVAIVMIIILIYYMLPLAGHPFVH
jgi:hypothetical protein